MADFNASSPNLSLSKKQVPASESELTPQGQQVLSQDPQREELLEILGGLVPEPSRTAEGKLNLALLPQDSFEKFQKTLAAQVSLNDGYSFYDPFSKLLLSDQYQPLLRALFEGKRIEAKDLIDLKSDLIWYNAKAFVQKDLGSEEGRNKLRSILADSRYGRKSRIELMKSIAQEFKSEQFDFAKPLEKAFSSHISLYNYWNIGVSDSDFDAAQKVALQILDSAKDAYQDLAHQEEQRPLLFQSLSLNHQVSATEYEGMQAYAKGLKGSSDPIQKAQLHLAELWLVAANSRHWPEEDASEARVYILKNCQSLIEASKWVKDEASFQRFSSDLVKFLEGDVGIEEGLLTHLGRRLGEGLSLEPILGRLWKEHRKSYEELKQLSDGWKYSQDMGEAHLYGSYQQLSSLPSGQEKQLASALLSTKQSLWTGYKQHRFVSRAMSEWGDEVLNRGDKHDIKRANQKIDEIIKRITSENPKDRVAGLQELMEAMQPEGVLFAALAAAENDGGEALLGLVQSMAEELAVSAVTAGAGQLLKLRALMRAGHSLQEARRMSQVAEGLGSSLSRGDRIIEVTLEGFKHGARSSVVSNAVSYSSGEAREGGETISKWMKDAIATGLSMSFTGGMAGLDKASTGGITQKLSHAYSRGITTTAKTIIKEGAEETVEELIDQQARKALDNKFEAIEFQDLQNTAALSFAGAPTHQVSKAIIQRAGDRKNLSPVVDIASKAPKPPLNIAQFKSIAALGAGLSTLLASQSAEAALSAGQQVSHMIASTEGGLIAGLCLAMTGVLASVWAGQTEIKSSNHTSVYEKRLQEVMRDLLNKVEPGSKVYVAAILTVLGDPQGLEAVLDFAKSEHLGERVIAAKTLGHSSDPRALGALLSLAKVEDSEVRSVAAEALGHSSDPRALEVLLSFVKDVKENFSVRKTAIQALRSSDPRALEALLSLAKDDMSHLLRSIITQALAPSSDPRTLDTLLSLAKDESSEVRLVAVRALFGHSSDPRVLEVLLCLARDEHRFVRGEVARALGPSSDPRALEALLSLVKDMSREVREIAAKALGRSSNPRALEVLLTLAKYEEDDMIDWAQEALLQKTDLKVLDYFLKEKLFEDRYILYNTLNAVFERNKQKTCQASPHPALKLSALIRSITAKLDHPKENQTVGFQNRGLHRGKRPTSSGFDFKELKEIRPGEPIEGRIVVVNGQYHQIVKEEKHGRNTHILLNPGVYQEVPTDILATISGTLAQIGLRRNDPVGLLIADGKEGQGVSIKSQAKGKLENIVKTTIAGSMHPAMNSIELLNQQILRSQLPRGSQVYLVSNFLNESDLEGLGRIIEHYRRMDITVTPIQSGRELILNKTIITVGARRYPLGLWLTEQQTMPVLEKRGEATLNFLARHQGFVVNHSDDKSAEAISKQVIMGVNAWSQSPSLPAKVKLEGEKLVDIPEQIPPPEAMQRLRQLTQELENPSSRKWDHIYELSDFYDEAREKGWGHVLDQFDLWARQAEKWFQTLSPDQQFAFSALPKDPRYWGLSSRDLYMIADWMKSQSVATPQTEAKPAHDLGEGLKSAASPFFSRRSDLITNRASKKEKHAKPQIINIQDQITMGQTAALEKTGKSHHPIWMTHSGKLNTTSHYFVTGLFGQKNSAFGTYAPIPGLDLATFKGTGKTQWVKARLTGEASVVSVPTPLGGQLSRKQGQSLEFEIPETQVPTEILGMKLTEFRTRGKELYGDHYATLTETAANPNLSADLQALMKSIESGSVQEAVEKIQAYVMQNIEYRHFNESEKSLYQEIQKRGEAGKLSGNEYLNFILSIRGGVCVELSEVTLELLRLAGIPTLKAVGYVAQNGEVSSEGHEVAVAVFPTRQPGSKTWAALPVEIYQPYLLEPQKPLEVSWKPSQETHQNEGPTEEKPKQATPTQETSQQEKVEAVTAPTPGLSKTEQYWKTRWEQANEEERHQISKAFEYYHHFLGLREKTLWGKPVTQLLLENPEQYERFPAGPPRSPLEWLPAIRVQNPSSAEIRQFYYFLLKI